MRSYGCETLYCLPGASAIALLGSVIGRLSLNGNSKILVRVHACPEHRIVKYAMLFTISRLWYMCTSARFRNEHLFQHSYMLYNACNKSKSPASDYFNRAMYVVGNKYLPRKMPSTLYYHLHADSVGPESTSNVAKVSQDHKGQMSTAGGCANPMCAVRTGCQVHAWNTSFRLDTSNRQSSRYLWRQYALHPTILELLLEVYCFARLCTKFSSKCTRLLQSQIACLLFGLESEVECLSLQHITLLDALQ